VGATALTAIPTGAHSTASALTRPLTACLLAQYAARPGYPTSPIGDEIATIRPPRPRPLTAAANERHARYVPRRLVSTTRSKSSTGCSRVGPGRLRPAAVT